MTFQQLTYVVEVSKCGSINKAAHKLFLSQSGISTAVRELEQELGIQFFTRSNRGVEFTPEGREFLGYAVSLLEQKQRIQELYKEDRSATAPAHFNVSSQRYPFTDDAFIETLQHTNEQLISTLDEVLNIQREGAEKRKVAEAELGRIEGELKQKLMELRS